MKLSEFFETHGWCQGNYALDEKGEVCLSTSPNAVSFCLKGGLMCYCKEQGLSNIKHNILRNKMLKKLEERRIFSIADFNDAPGRTKEEIITFLKEIGE